MFRFFRNDKKVSVATESSNEDPTAIPSSQSDSVASHQSQENKNDGPLRSTIEAAAAAELTSRAHRLSCFEWIFFGYSLIICSLILCSIHSLSTLYFSGHLLEKLGSFKDWHILAASDAIFAGLTLVFMTVFLSALKMISNNAETIQKTSGKDNIVDTDENNKDKADCIPNYLHNIICALKELVTAIKGIPK